MKSQKSVPAAELDVLAALKKLGEATAREIREDIHSFRPMAHGSTVNLLLRLRKTWTPILLCIFDILDGCPYAP